MFSTWPVATVVFSWRKRENPDNFLPRIPRPVFMLFARGTSISFKQWRQSGANLGIVALAKTDNYRGALSVRPQKVEVCVCLLESKTNPIHESALSCFLLFLDHFTVLNKRTTFFIPITRKMQFCPVLACVASVSNRFFFFLLLSQLSRRTSRGNACYAG